MRLEEAISATGMTPPYKLAAGRWLRFPGIGKGKANRAGWCRVITPTLAIFGDWSSGFTDTWRDDTHRDDENSRRLLQEARDREKRFAAEQRARQATVAREAESLVSKAMIGGHPYLERKGFKDRSTLVWDGKIVIPIRDAEDYKTVISAQLISEDGEKRFLTGGRTRGGIHRLGIARAERTVLCEGYATGLSLHVALMRLTQPAVIICFSARNLELVASRFPNAIVCADNDESRTGEECAKRTGLRWIMPPDVGTDFNDMHQRYGLYAVVDVLREAFASSA